VETPELTSALQLKVCIVGPYAVGKTSLVRRYVENLFDEDYPNVQDLHIERKRIHMRGQELNLHLWALTGDDELAQMRVSHLSGAAGYILVADGTRPHTLHRLSLLRQLMAATLGPLPFVTAVNKADLDRDWLVDEAALERAERLGAPCFLTSARTGKGVQEVFDALAALLLSIHGAKAHYA
jgi:small GTP-binding protein